MKIEKTGYYRAREGDKVHIVHIRDDGTTGAYKFIGYVRSVPDAWNEDGTCQLGPSWNDIVSEWYEPRTGSAWVNVNGCPNGGTPSLTMHMSREGADKVASESPQGSWARIACVEVKWVEGEGL